MSFYKQSYLWHPDKSEPEEFLANFKQKYPVKNPNKSHLKELHD